MINVADEGAPVNPADLQYTREHEWVRVSGDVARFGITDFAQDSLGDIVYVNLPEVGEALTLGEPCGEVESHKSVSDLFAPVDGEVSAVNESVAAAPELVNSDPYGAGWLVEVTVGQNVDGLLTATQYEDYIESL
ncbi:MAG: glycine cleavage system protein GcvH [Actinobacteria bacterium]|nr:glycine cleavage system protein GcvH [Actinomycetota bacterium]